MNAIVAAMTTQDEAVDREQSEELRKGPTRVHAELLAHWNRLVGLLPPDLAHRRPCLLGPAEAFPDEHAPASYFDDWTDHDPERMGPSSMAVTRRLASRLRGLAEPADGCGVLRGDPCPRNRRTAASATRDVGRGSQLPRHRRRVGGAGVHDPRVGGRPSQGRGTPHVHQVPVAEPHGTGAGSRWNRVVELLSLPEPAARIWKRAGGALQKALTQTGNPPLRWSIGGGTILARRWQHRESTDIDLTAPAGTGIDRRSAADIDRQDAPPGGIRSRKHRHRRARHPAGHGRNRCGGRRLPSQRLPRTTPGQPHQPAGLATRPPSNPVSSAPGSNPDRHRFGRRHAAPSGPPQRLKRRPVLEVTRPPGPFAAASTRNASSAARFLKFP